ATIGFVPSGNVYYLYSVADGATATAFSASARGDLDADGNYAIYTTDETGEIGSPAADEY
ncbi:MAG: hypothetical protein AB1847_06590, partial [bacterium]